MSGAIPPKMRALATEPRLSLQGIAALPDRIGRLPPVPRRERRAERTGLAPVPVELLDGFVEQLYGGVEILERLVETDAHPTRTPEQFRQQTVQIEVVRASA